MKTILLIIMLVLSVTLKSRAADDTIMPKLDTFADKNGNLTPDERLDYFICIENRKIDMRSIISTNDIPASADPAQQIENINKVLKNMLKNSPDEAKKLINAENNLLEQFRAARSDAQQTEASFQDYLKKNHIKNDEKSYSTGVINDFTYLNYGDQVYADNKPINLGHLMLRRSYNMDIDDPVEVSESDTTFKKPALFSYTKTFDKGEDIWTAQGTLLYPFDLTPKDPTDTSKTPDSKATQTSASVVEYEQEHAYISRLMVVPSVSFDKLSGSKTAKNNVDSLIPRVGVIADLYDTVLNLEEFRFYVDYGTDFKFKSSTVAQEFEWEPYYHPFGLGMPNSIGNAVRYQLDAYFHEEYGDVLDVGNQMNLTRGAFLRTGPRVALSLQPIDVPDLVFSVQYGYDWGLSGSPVASDNWEFELNYQLTSNFSIDVSYENGETPLIKDDTDTFLASLGIKF